MKYRIVEINDICPCFIVEGRDFLSWSWVPLQRAKSHPKYIYLHETEDEAIHTIATRSGLFDKASRIAKRISRKQVESYP